MAIARERSEILTNAQFICAQDRVVQSRRGFFSQVHALTSYSACTMIERRADGALAAEKVSSHVP